jgi:hypothetical protein
MQEANYGHQQELDMIPLMMQKDYSANGWLGLILGTRMWYAMWDAEQDDDAAFNNRLDSVVREIGDRGKVLVAEAVPPLHEPTPAPEPAPAPAPALAPAPAPAPASTSAAAAAAAPAAAPAPAPAGAGSAGAFVPPLTPMATAARASSTTAQISLTPCMMAASSSPTAMTLQREAHNDATSLVPSTGVAGASLIELSAFMTEQLKDQIAEQRAHDKAQHEEVMRLLNERDAQARAGQLELEARFDAQRKEMMRLQARPKTAAEVISEPQLEALQERLQSLHAAELLTDDTMHVAEDCIADCIELMPDAAATMDPVEKALTMVKLSEKMAADKSFARQLQRKFL